MSVYGYTEREQEKEKLFKAINEFLETHSTWELMEVVRDVFEYKEDGTVSSAT